MRAKNKKEKGKKEMTNELQAKIAAKNKQKKKKVSPTTSQKSIPYIACYQNGMIQSRPGIFVKAYSFPEANFKTLSDEDQEKFFEKYEVFLNSFESTEHVTFNLLNLKDDLEVRFEKIKMREKNDGLDKYRKELNEMVYDKMKNSRGNIITKRYFTVSIADDDVDLAAARFKDIDIRVEREVRNFLKAEIHALNIDEYIELLSEIYGTNDSVFFIHDKEGGVKIDYESMKKLNLTTKDIIAPPAFKFNQFDFQVGEEYAQSLYLDGIANFLSTDFIGNITELNSKLLLSIDLMPVDQAEGQKIVHNKQVLVDSEIAEAQKKAVKSGYSPDLISSDLMMVKDQIEQLQQDMSSRDQRVFYFQISLTHFADSKEALKRGRSEVKSAANKNMCNFRDYIFQQEKGFNACLPLGVNESLIKAQRLLTTENVAGFMPFSETNFFQEDGSYYGNNIINKSPIILNRRSGMNYNALILGTPGSGKSFAAKQEFVNTFLKTDNSEIYIIDPEGEYAPVVTALGGSEIKIAPGNGVYLNPFDLNMDNSFDKEVSPLAMQADTIASLCETILAGGSANAHNYLTTGQRAIINTCCTKLYSNYLNHLKTLPPDKDGKIVTIDRNASPTLQDLWNLLLTDVNPEAREIALAMQLYTSGQFDTFAHRTNVDINNKMTVFNIRDIGVNLQELGLKVCLNYCWQKIVENRAKGIWTYIYIDEFHLLMSSPSSAETIKSIFKRARKFGGAICGITQNTEDLLQSPSARAVINNCYMVTMLNQSLIDRENLQELFSLSDNEIQFISTELKGRGIIHFGKTNIPFYNEFPRETELYKLLTTEPTA